MSQSDYIIETNLGKVKGQKCVGVYDDVYYAFEKIPFAEVPVGSLRFLPPTPKQPWSDILDCTKQPMKPMQKNPLTNQVEGSEDCLYLNIYAKQLSSEKPLPVMVFLFGGGFEKGDPSRDLHGPDYLMMKDMIFVTIGYRLGPLGFLTLKDPDLKIPGNSGLKDQLMALRWIKENIGKFNGDQNNITLAGESAGAASVHYHMCSPLSKGLFHKAILMSGTVLCPWAFSPLENLPYRLAKACGYEGTDATNEKQILAYLQKLPAEELHKPYINNKDECMNDFLFTFGPNLETYETDLCMITKEPEYLLKNAWGNEIPAMMSGTSFEGLLMFARVHMTQFLLTELEENPQHMLPYPLKKKYSQDLQRKLGAQLKSLHFGEKKAEIANIMNYCEYASHKVFWSPILKSLKTRLEDANAGVTYMYRFDFDSAEFNHQRVKYCGKQMRGVAHVDDHSYLFYGNFSWKLSKDTAEYATIQRMIDIWYAFASNANPCSQLIEAATKETWPAVSDWKNVKCLNIGEDLKLIDLPEMEKLKVWQSLYDHNEENPN